jgi:uncharacterized protein (TIGR00266 family)
MRRIPTQIARRGAALRRQRRQRVSLAANLSPLPADPTKSSYPDSAPIDFDASSAVSGGEAQVLEVSLRPGQRLRAEAGSMLYMSAGVAMETTLGSDGITGGIGRALTGQSAFLTDYAYTGPPGTVGTVGLGAAFPSKIVRLDLDRHGGRLVCQKGAYLASSGTHVAVRPEPAPTLGAGFFGGEGFVLQRLEGTGQVFVCAGGTLVRRELGEGETLRISSGCLVAFTAGIDYDVATVPGFRNVMFGGEGLFVTTLTGRVGGGGGAVGMQGQPPDRMVSEIARRVPAGGGIGLGVPIGGMGGGGGGGADEGEGEGEGGLGEGGGGGGGGGELGGGGEAVAATDAAIDADRQATVASSGLFADGDTDGDADSPSALFGDAAPEGADATQVGLGQDPYPELGDFADGDAQIGPPEVGDFADGTHFSTADEPPPDDFGDGFGSSEEEFDAGSFGGGDGGGAEEDGPGLLGQIWDFFNDFNED